jgi:hypothetical protein
MSRICLHALQIDERLAPAVDTLKELLDSGAAGTFDFAFCDANKRGYMEYHELLLQVQQVSRAQPALPYPISSLTYIFLILCGTVHLKVNLAHRILSGAMHS